MFKRIIVLVCMFTCIHVVRAHRLAYKPLELDLGNSKCFVLEANASGDQKPWVWYAPTLPAHPDRSHAWYIEVFSPRGSAWPVATKGRCVDHPGAWKYSRSFIMKWSGEGILKNRFFSVIAGGA